MSRFFRPTRFLTPLSSRFTSGQSVIFHKVKVTRAKYSYGGRLNRILVFGGATYFTYKIYAHYVIQPYIEAVEAAEEAGLIPEESEEEEDEDEKYGLFLPIPLTTKQVTPPPYSGKDPEWQEFIRVSKDMELQKRMRSMAVAKVLNATRGRVFTFHFGKPTKVCRVWLDIDYPLYPPPEFEQTGILITSDIVGIAVRERDPLVAQLEKRVLWPKPIAMSILVLFKEHFKLQGQQIRKFFGRETVESKPEPSYGQDRQLGPPSGPADNDVRKSIQALRQQATRRPGGVPESETNREPAAENPAMKTPPLDPTKPSSALGNTSTSRKVDQPPSKNEIPVPIVAAFKKFMELYRPFRQHPVRGCVAVTGMVEVETPRYWVYLDVFAWYNPKTNDYHEESLVFRVNRWRQKKKTPLR